MKKLIRYIVRWALDLEDYETQERKIKNFLNNFEVSVDVHQYAHSWAVVSIQGRKSDFIKFIDLGPAEILDIQKFLRQFDRTKVDASPQASKFLKFQ